MIINVKIIPRQPSFKIDFDEGLNLFKIHLKSSPEKGKANRELIKQLQRICNCDVRIEKGRSSRNKVLFLGNAKAYDCLRKQL